MFTVVVDSNCGIILGMLYLFFNGGKKEIYILDNRFSKKQKWLFVFSFSSILIGFIIILLSTLIINTLDLSIQKDYTIIVFATLFVYVWLIFLVVSKLNNQFMSWYLKKYCGNLGIIYYRNNSDQLRVLIGNKIESYTITKDSYIVSNLVDRNHSISIFIDQSSSINLCDYFGGDTFSPKRIGSQIKSGKLRVYGIDDLLSQFLNIQMKKNYDDTIDN